MHPFYDSVSQLLREENTWWLGLASMFMYLLFWAIVIVIVLRNFKKYYAKTEPRQAKEDTAMSILRERYAKGEIDAEEFKQKKADLE